LIQEQELSPSQAARLLGLSAKRVSQLCDSHALAHRRTPLGRLIPRVALVDFALGRGIVIPPADPR
jgi:hypothetical protein